MESDFWDIAFGGKDMLRLYLGAKDFRISRNRHSVHARFKYGDGYQVGIWYTRMWDYSSTYYIRLDRNRVSLDQRISPEIEMIRPSVQKMTGYVLDCFQN